MTQSGLRIFNSFKGKQSKLKKDSDSPDNVQGWLLNVHSFRKEEKKTNVEGFKIVDANNNGIPVELTRRNDGRPESIHSVDSVNLDELISANYTADMDDETDLPDLADLDIIDDSTEDFWILNQTGEITSSFDSGFNEFVVKPVELEWNAPSERKGSIAKPLLNKTISLRKRSDSLSSDNSLTSQSTVTQYAKYGMTPMVYPSESSSSSSRPVSRQSNYSAGSLASSSGIHTRPTTGIPTPSRSSTKKEKTRIPATKSSGTKLTKRASHIPTSQTSSSKRASHIPTAPHTSPRVLRSPTPGSRLFQDEKRIPSPTQRPSGLRPPTNGSRMGVYKKI